MDTRNRFWGNSFEESSAPPKTIIFPVDETVTVCFQTRPTVLDSHIGFRAEISEIKKEKGNTF